MVNTISELKELIIWAKEQSLQSLKIGDVEFKFSEAVAAQAIIEKYGASPQIENKASSDTLVDTEAVDAKEEEELLFYSSR